ncbi:MAG: DOMON domain-containing protein [Methanomassiliicoccales archaeon]
MKAYGWTAAAMAALLMFCAIPFNGSEAATPSSPIMDGEIAEGEYEHAADLSGGDFLLRWHVQGDTVFFAMSAITDGYLSIGFDPEFLMKDADLVVGWVNGTGDAFIVDAYSTGQFGPVVLDTELGGTDDILGSAGVVREGWTVVEFSRALSTGDHFDKDISLVGEIVVMWAIGGVFDPATMPEDGGMVTIAMSSGASSESVLSHSYLVVLAPVALAATIIALLVLLGPDRFRTTGHLLLGVVAAGTVSCSALVVLLFGVQETPPGLAWPLLVTTALVVSTVLIGAAALRIGRLTWLKKGHVLSAAAAMVGLVWCTFCIFWP